MVWQARFGLWTASWWSLLYWENKVCALAKHLGESTRDLPVTPSSATGSYRMWHQAKCWINYLQTAGHMYPLHFSVREAFQPLMIPTTRPVIGCMKPASHLIFVDLNGPPLERFDPVPYIISCIKSAHHLHHGLVGKHQRQLIPGHCGHIYSMLR